MQYSETTIYGLNRILKEYARFPKVLPLPCHIEHGWTSHLEALKSDLKIDKPLMLVFSKRRKDAWEKEKKSPAFIAGAPFIHYKNLKKISRKADAAGTVVFPSHSTRDTKSVFNVRNYCEKLESLPEEFKPLTICLFWPDYKDKSAEIYRQFGFKVTTAGRYLKGLGFIKRFYKILARHRYASSNEVGSYSFYAVDLGIPFFLSGELPVCKNVGTNQDMKKIMKPNETPFARDTIGMFSTGPINSISARQAEFVLGEIGINDCLSRGEMNKLLWKYYREDKSHAAGTLIYWGISLLLFLGLAAKVKSVIDNLRNTK